MNLVLNRTVGLKAVVKPIAENAIWAVFPHRRIRHTVSDLVLRGEYDELREFLLSEWGKLSNEPMSTEALVSKVGQSVRLCQIGANYFEHFGSFTETLISRRAYQDAVVSKRGSLWFFSRWAQRAHMAVERHDVSFLHRRERPPWKEGKPTRFFRRPSKHKTSSRLSHNGFDQAVAGKKVLILGPAPGGSVTQEFTDTFDVLAIPKLHKGMWLGEGTVAREHQIVITYLNHQTVARVLREDFLDTSGWHIARVKSVDDVAAIESKIPADVLPKRQVGLMSSPDEIMMNDYGAFMGPAMVFDLLCSRPASLHLSGFTFYVDTDAGTYRATYDSRNHSDVVLVNALRTHGAFSNFLFVKSLWQWGIITGDQEMETVLSMSAEDYADYLDRRFGLGDYAPPSVTNPE